MKIYTVGGAVRVLPGLRTIGLYARGITSLFMIENVVLALLFSLIGVAAALVVAGVLVTFVPLPAAGTIALFLDKGHVVLIPRVRDVAGIVLLIAAFSAVFSFFPARRGGKIRPVDALTRIF